MPYPCVGPSVSSVLSPIRSSVPCSTSAFLVPTLPPVEPQQDRRPALWNVNTKNHYEANAAVEALDGSRPPHEQAVGLRGSSAPNIAIEKADYSVLQGG